MVEFAPFLMVVAIVAIVSWSRLQRARLERSAPPAAAADSLDAERLRGEVRALKDRIQVLEAIVTDGDRNRTLALEREIEALRHNREESRS